VYTTFEGRLGAVDERLIAEDRLRRLAAPDQLDLGRRPRAGAERPEIGQRVRRDPAVLVGLLLSALEPRGDSGPAATLRSG
jgi:hypothetical protein